MVQPIYRPLVQSLIRNDSNKTKKVQVRNDQDDFAKQLKSAFCSDEDSLIISKHAKQRLNQRGIQINKSKWQQINEKVIKAKQMGINESLVLIENAALIISTKNQTVITAMDRKEASEQIFTNIDGTILID